MMARSRLVGMLVAAAAPAYAQAPPVLCERAIALAETQLHIPSGFLSAIGQVESGQSATPQMRTAWPWTINAGGEGHFYPSKDAAIEAARRFLATGVKSIDVGCLQVNLLYHPAAFASLEQAFEPAANAAYAARFLADLYQKTGSWPRAAAAYHSMTPGVGSAYAAKVLAAWALPDPRLPYRAADGAPVISAIAPGDSAPAASRENSAAPPPVAARKIGTVVPSSRTAQAAPQSAGRTLAAYRAYPVRLAGLAPRAMALPLHTAGRSSAGSPR
jgi:hypothetical protein